MIFQRSQSEWEVGGRGEGGGGGKADYRNYLDYRVTTESLHSIKHQNLTLEQGERGEL